MADAGHPRGAIFQKRSFLNVEGAIGSHQHLMEPGLPASWEQKLVMERPIRVDNGVWDIGCSADERQAS
ncbi:hypothetical protein HHL08_19670 [Sphingobium sp. AR-3-1]|uniref:Uncharacterized protein n=1 Tax=Sphingobium psychrophilum TaxID=2728834 RepID=A0A7X9WZD6_9SPHN|nr:hypothetical protein [Sphingobium psychrophilum]NML12328.1 hypothetical protein [Sphingobium psychrophilum]